MRRVLRAVQSVEFLSQHGALEGAAGLALVFRRQSVRQYGVREQGRSRLHIGQARFAVVLAHILVIEQAGEVTGTRSRPRYTPV